MNKFGRASAKNIATVHNTLGLFAYKTLEKVSKENPWVDITVLRNGGIRTAGDQYQLHLSGASPNCDGYKVRSYHQTGMAIDLVPYLSGQASWSNSRAFLLIAKAAFEAWEEMAEDMKAGYFLHWGGYWSAKDLNDNGLLDIDDKLGWDLPHWELRTYKQVRGVMPIW